MVNEFVCNLCARNCSAYRTPSHGDGVCGCGTTAYVSRAAAHFGEEPCISGKRGSGTVFFSGCPLRCVFCQNSQISRSPFYGREFDAKGLRQLFDKLAAQGVHNINLVSPTQYSAVIEEALKEPLTVPVVWNSNGYEKLETLRTLNGKVQIYLPDMKYSDDALGARLSGVDDYFNTAKAAIDEMITQTGPCAFDENGMLISGVIVRHLVLPGHLDNSRGVIDWFAHECAPRGAYFSLMTQYTPMNDLSKFEDINRTLSRRECTKIEDYLYYSGIINGFVQDRESATCELLPSFDFTGIEGL